MISVAIYTFNEEVNLPYCLDSLSGCDDVVIVDSFSTDRTCEIANKWGARVFQNKFTGFGDQRNWSLKNIPFHNPWVLILDADERVTPELWSEMLGKIKKCPNDVGAFRLKRRFFWEGKCLQYSNFYPTWIVRLIRLGRVTFINRGHAETQNVEGAVISLNEDLIDEDHKGLQAWHVRQEKYAEQEALYEASIQLKLKWADVLNSDPVIRRDALKSISRKIPFRGLSYFIYVYFFRFGFLDGILGLKFCLEKAKYQNIIKSIQKNKAIHCTD
jgi:glycosyltransferase involved in cell wall biosynthesis